MEIKTKIPSAFATEHTEATEILVPKDKEKYLTYMVFGCGYAAL